MTALAEATEYVTSVASLSQQLFTGGLLAAPLVLLVDDDVFVRRVLSEMLTALGCAVLEATGARDAISQAAQGRALDLALIDFRMPELNGSQVAEAIRRQLPHLPLVLVSATRVDDLTGFDAVLHKPFRFSELRELLICLGLQL